MYGVAYNRAKYDRTVYHATVSKIVWAVHERKPHMIVNVPMNIYSSFYRYGCGLASSCFFLSKLL